MCSHRSPDNQLRLNLSARRKRFDKSTHFVISRRRYVKRILMDGIIDEISLAFGDLQDCTARAIQTPDHDLHTLDKTADLFSVWLRNVAVIREQCKTFEHCLNSNSELKATLIELLVDVKDDLAEGGCGFFPTKLAMEWFLAR